MKEELTREITRWCVTWIAYHLVGTHEDDTERVDDDDSVEYFATKEKAQARYDEIKAEMDEWEFDGEGILYDLTIEEEDGTWITETEYQNYYLEDLEG